MPAASTGSSNRCGSPLISGHTTVSTTTSPAEIPGSRITHDDPKTSAAAHPKIAVFQ